VGFRVDLVFHAVALSFDDDGLGMMEDAIEQSYRRREASDK